MRRIEIDVTINWDALADWFQDLSESVKFAAVLGAMLLALGLLGGQG